MIVIDGSMGEGGGQILRSTLALSMITGEPVRIDAIRAGRKRPGLLRQHLACVRAATALGGAEVTGDHLGSRSLTFRPGSIRGGDLTIAVGSAGSALLVAQAVLPAMLVASSSTRLVVEGGTHNPSAPPFPFVERALVPALASMGADVRFTLERPGFFPAGGGCIVVQVRPARLDRLRMPARGPIHAWKATVLLSDLPDRIARDELSVVATQLPIRGADAHIERVVDPVGPGNAVWIEAHHQAGTSVFTAFGRRGLAARHVARAVTDQALAWERAAVPVCAHLADQLLLPMAIAGGGAFETVEPTLHTRTNIAVIERFLPVRFQVEDAGEGRARVICRGA